MRAMLIGLCLMFLAVGLNSQTVVSSSCGTMDDGQCIVNWTLGEVVSSTMEMENMSVTQGYHQPKIIPIPTMGTWALIILILILANCATIKLYQLKNSPSIHLSK